jgi:hypothetical protein
MKITQVTSKKYRKKFILFPVELYKNEAAWIRPLDRDIEKLFDASSNNYFQEGDCVNWILEKENKIIGRISAFYRNENALIENNQLIGGIGFFECVNCQEAANLLFDTAKSWLKSNGMEAMDGPINFGDRDKWWGLLTKGFHLEPNYQCNYHLPYYKTLFENYGFRNYFNQFTFRRKITDPLNHRLKYKAELIAKDPDYTFEHLNDYMLKKQTLDIIEIYNKAWKDHKGVSQLTQEQGENLFKKLKPILDERIIWLAYYKNKPAGFYINIPDVNQVLKHLNGKINLLGTLKFLRYKWGNKKHKMLGIVFGIIPEHQGKGLDGALIMNAAKTMQNLSKTYPILEINGIGDFNKKMIIVVKQVGGEICKTHTTYRYLFDRSQTFQRMTAL